MNVLVRGKGEVQLTQAHYVATGGQASVYQRNGTAYKIYTDPKQALPDAKLTALSKLRDPNVVKPDDALLDPRSSSLIGYTMRFLQNCPALCQLFTRAFRDRNGITHDVALKLVGKLREHVAAVHRDGVLIVDLNELNILVEPGFTDLYLIDVDSYQAPGFPAEVIMPSVRDWSVEPKRFSELSDWFSFAVLAFQMMVGIHPYRGRHDKSAAIAAEKRLEHRMRAHISVFNADVTVPAVCYPTDVIPQLFRGWLRAVLEDGKRLPPPDPTGTPAPVVEARPKTTASSAALIITEVGTFDGDIIDYAESAGRVLVLTTTGVYLDGRKIRSFRLPGTFLAGFTPKMARPILLHLHNDMFRLIEMDGGRETFIPIQPAELARSADRFYVRARTRVLELELADMPAQVVPTASRTVADVLESASHLYEGVAIQSMLGAAFVSIFARAHAGYQVRVLELDRYRVVDAKCDGNVLMVVGAMQGRYDRLVFRFDADFANYDVRVISDVQPNAPNFVVLHSGVCVCLNEDESLEIFQTTIGVGGARRIEDPALGNDMRLIRVGGRLGFTRGRVLAQMTMRRP